MSLENIVDKIIWGGLEIAEKIPFRLLRFLGVFVAYLVMLISSILWIPLALIVGFKDIWDDLKKRK